jgi:hypothetical protein
LALKNNGRYTYVLKNAFSRSESEMESSPNTKSLRSCHFRPITFVLTSTRPLFFANSRFSDGWNRRLLVYFSSQLAYETSSVKNSQDFTAAIMQSFAAAMDITSSTSEREISLLVLGI